MIQGASAEIGALYMFPPYVYVLPLQIVMMPYIYGYIIWPVVFEKACASLVIP